MALGVPLRAHPGVTNGYYQSQGYHAGHKALDMVGILGQPVYAAQAGIVFAAEWNGRGWAYGGGNVVIIDHFGKGLARAKTAYAHLSRMVVVRGQYVMKGQLIGYSGSTGNSSGAHVHFSVGIVISGKDPNLYYSYDWRNPYLYLPAHRFANGYHSGGGYVGHYVLRNVFTVNAGVNMRSGPGTGYGIIKTTAVRTNTIFLGQQRGYIGGTAVDWYRVYDPTSGRVAWVASTLGGLS